MSRLLLAVLFALFLPLSSVGQVQWLTAKTAHFTVVTDGNERQLRETATQLERMQGVFAMLLPNAADDATSSTVVLALRSQQAFQALEPPAYLSRHALELAGYFLRGEDRNYLLLHLEPGGEHPYGTIYHEYTHYMVRHTSDLPLWLNEGLAQFYQYAEFHRGEVQFGTADPQAVDLLGQATLLPIPVLLQVDSGSPYYHEEDAGSIFYAESWALTRFLMLSDADKPKSRLREYMNRIHAGSGSLVAAQQAFGDLSMLQADFERSLRAGDLQNVSLKLNEGTAEAAVAVTHLPVTQADALRADVLVRNGRVTEGEALLRTVLAQDANNLQAYETLGLLRLKQHQLAAAQAAFAEAATLHSADFLAWYYAGALAIHEGLDDSRVVADTLRQALRLNPDYAPACDALTQFDIAHGADLDEALRLSSHAVALDPKNVQYRMDAAEVRVARHEVGSAAAALRAALPLAADPEQASAVEARLEEIRSFQAKQEQSERTRAGRLSDEGGDAERR